MLNTIEINFKLDKTIKRALKTELTIKSHDINVIEFHISFDGLELTADHTVKVLSVFNYTKSQTNVICDIADGKAIYRPDTSIISQYEYVRNYVYVYHGNQSLDVREFIYSVSLSKIDETALKVKEVYDQSYSDLLENFERALTDYKDTLPQASDLRAEVDVILNKFKTDSDAKLSQFDADAQQAIADNQTAFDLAESGRQNNYEQAEDSRNQASNQAVVDWGQGADALVDSKLIEMQTDASTLINGAIDGFKLRGDAEIADWRVDADVELEDYLADRVILKNLVTNGDFSQGTNGWDTTLTSGFTVVSGISEFIATRVNGRIEKNIGVISANEKYYAFAKVKADSRNVSLITTDLTVGGITASHTGDNTFQLLSGVYTQSTDKSISVRIVDRNESVWTKIYATNIMVINLTQTFGAGNEPTKSEMDELIKITGYFDEITLTQKQMLNWQLKLMRQNRNALIALGGTII